MIVKRIIFYSILFILSYVGVFSARCLCKKYGWVVNPRDDRWHTKPTALHGGVGFFFAILVGFAFVCFNYFPKNWYDFYQPNVELPAVAKMLALFLGSLIMFFLGCVDDIVQLKPNIKFIVQLISVSIIIVAGGVFNVTQHLSIDIFITYFWFIGIINAVNMIDNMDGLSSGIIIIASVTIVILALNSGADQIMTVGVDLGLILVFVLLGFWFQNRYPAKIFMGDSGSLSIGFILAAIAIPSDLNNFFGFPMTGQTFSMIKALIVPSLVLAVPIFDVTLVTITRKWRAQKASNGGRDHSSHRLAALGFSERMSVRMLYGLSALGSFVALAIQRIPGMSYPLLAIYVVILILAGIYLGRVKIEVSSDGDLQVAWTHIVKYVLFKMRLGEVILDAILILLCYYSAYLLRFEGVLTSDMKFAIIRSVPIILSSCLLSFFIAGIYSRRWQIASFMEVPRFVIGVVSAVVSCIALVTIFSRFGVGQSRAAYFIFGILLLISMIAVRISFHLISEYLSPLSNGDNGKEITL